MSAQTIMARAILLLTAGIASIAVDAHAQSVDYGAFEQLFGEPVTTSATGSPQRVSEAPVAMEIVTADDIRRSGAADIPGILRHVAGVDVMEWANDNADVSIRGYDQAFSPRLLVLIDGRQVYADYYGYTPWSTLPVELDAIRQIEVVKGPNSALFGFNAVGGVINIITYDPLRDDVNQVSLTGGTQGFAQGSSVSTFRFGDRAAVRLELGGRSDDDFSTPLPPTIFGPGRRGNNRGEFDIDGRIRLGDNYEFEIEGSRTQADQNQVDPLYFLEYARFTTGSIKGQLTGDTEFGLIKATAYTNWLTHEDQTGVLGTLDLQNEVTVVQLEDVFKLGADHTFRASAEYRHNTMPTTTFVGGNVAYDVFSAGGMWNWQMTPSLSLTNALRVDHLMLGRDGPLPPAYPFTNADWDREITQPSFNSGLVWRFDDLDTLRLTASRGVQVPNLVYSGGGTVLTPFLGLTGVPTLEPTIVQNYEIDWDRALPGLNADLRIGAFHEITTDIVSIPTSVLAPFGYPYLTTGNIGDSIASGLEIELKGTFCQDWRWGLNYRAEAITDHFTATPTAQAFGIGVGETDFQHTAPVHQLNANLGWSKGPWEIDGYLHYQSLTYGILPTVTQLSATLAPISDYISFDGRVAYKVTDWATISLSGQNLGQGQQRQTAVGDIERRVLGTLSIRY